MIQYAKYIVFRIWLIWCILTSSTLPFACICMYMIELSSKKGERKTIQGRQSKKRWNKEKEKGIQVKWTAIKVTNSPRFLTSEKNSSTNSLIKLSSKMYTFILPQYSRSCLRETLAPWYYSIILLSNVWICVLRLERNLLKMVPLFQVKETDFNMCEYRFYWPWNFQIMVLTTSLVSDTDISKEKHKLKDIKEKHELKKSKEHHNLNESIKANLASTSVLTLGA